MEPKDLFERALDHASGCIRLVDPEHLGNATPCTEWNLKQLINHIVYELSWVPDMLEGKTIAEVGDKYDGDLLGEDYQRAWDNVAEKALSAVKLVDPAKIVHLSAGDKPAGDYIAEVGADMLVHGWDVDQSVWCSMIMDKTLAQAVYDNSLPKKEQFAKSKDYAGPIEVAKDADVQTKLLGLMGRSTDWNAKTT